MLIELAQEYIMTNEPSGQEPEQTNSDVPFQTEYVRLNSHRNQERAVELLKNLLFGKYFNFVVCNYTQKEVHLLQNLVLRDLSVSEDISYSIILKTNLGEWTLNNVNEIPYLIFYKHRVEIKLKDHNNESVLWLLEIDIPRE